MQGQLGYFELRSGQRYYFDPQETFRDTFRFLLGLEGCVKRTPRPEPPELLRALADAKDRREAVALVMGGASHLPIDKNALVERGEFVHRSLLAGHEFDEYRVLRPTRRDEFR